jgi:putative SOS response-associated peptidase YedK
MADPEKPKPFYQPYPADLMEMHPVSPLVSNPRNDSHSWIEPPCEENNPV